MVMEKLTPNICKSTSLQWLCYKMAIAFHCAKNTFLRIVNFNIKYIFRFDSSLFPTSKEFNWHRSQVSGAFSHSLGALSDLKNLIAFFEQKKNGKCKLWSLLLIYFPGTTVFKDELRVDKTFLKRFLKAQNQRWSRTFIFRNFRFAWIFLNPFNPISFYNRNNLWDAASWLHSVSISIQKRLIE